MNTKHHLRAQVTCVNCGHIVPENFCSHCGEKLPSDHDHSLWHFIAEWFELLFHFDSKFLRTVRLLVLKPGFLTTEYWTGRRVRYMKPFQLLILLNVLYFVSFIIASHWGFGIRVMFPSLSDIIIHRVYSPWLQHLIMAHRPSTGPEWLAYQKSFDEHIEQLAKSLVVLLVPILAGILRLLYFRVKRTFLDHFIASFHLISFYILLWSIYIVAVGAAIQVCSLFSYPLHIPGIVGYLPLAVLIVYIFLALHRMYQQRFYIDIVITLLIIFVGIHVITQIYDFILFWILYVFL